jgi:cytochrome b6-f complex iron-sulfur subunit
MAENKRMSVAEILAAARAQRDGAAEAAPASPKQASAESVGDAGEASAPAAKKPAPTKASEPKAPAAKSAGGGGRPSVAEIMAMARAKKDGGEQPAEKPAAAAAKSAEKPAAKAAAKPAAAKAASKAAAVRDTASILAAARAGTKPGPTSKADAPPGLLARAAAAPRPKEAAAPAKAVAAKTAPPMPVRPAKPETKKAAAGAEEDRRGFLQVALGSFLGLGFTALSVTSGLFTLGLARFLFPNVLAEPPSRFKVGFKEGFPAGKVETKFVAQYGVWVVNGEFQGQQQIYALKTVCTHLGCTPNWLEAEQKFKCPCHGSGFYKDGVNFEGPAPRPLERYAVRLADDGQLEIDKSKSFHEELGQWSDSESFIPV